MPGGAEASGERAAQARTAYAEVPPRVEYEPTALGESPRETVLALPRWVTDHPGEIAAARRCCDAR